jgi:hypothetical protein
VPGQNNKIKKSAIEQNKQHFGSAKEENIFFEKIKSIALTHDII